MSIQHDYYEGLCAAAVSGEIAQDERTILERHMQSCDECRVTLSDFRESTCPALWLFAAEQFSKKPNHEMTARFVARAHTEGIPLSYVEHKQNRSYWLPCIRLTAEFVGTTLIFILSLRLVANRHHSLTPNDSSGTNRVTEPDFDATNLVRRRVEQSTRGEELNQLLAELVSKQRELELAKSELIDVCSRLANLERDDKDLRNDLLARDNRITILLTQDSDLKSALEKLQTAKASQEFVLQTKQSEMEELRAEVRLLSERIDQRQQLSAAAEQAEDLIVARHLHIIDVHDNALGNQPRPFGRIFYAENKKLIFYAYDLGDSRKLSKVSLFVWGEKSGTTDAPKHLGILHSDDTRDGRWVVTIDDPQTLAEINTVFVTAESPKKQITKPSGNRILEAFIGGQPNHP